MFTPRLKGTATRVGQCHVGHEFKTIGHETMDNQTIGLSGYKLLDCIAIMSYMQAIRQNPAMKLKFFGDRSYAISVTSRATVKRM